MPSAPVAHNLTWPEPGITLSASLTGGPPPVTLCLWLMRTAGAALLEKWRVFGGPVSQESRLKGHEAKRAQWQHRTFIDSHLERWVSG